MTTLHLVRILKWGVRPTDLLNVRRRDLFLLELLIDVDKGEEEAHTAIQQLVREVT